MNVTKDWNGNTKSIFVTHGASNHSEDERAERDYYATDPEAVKKLLEREKFHHYVLEPCCGDGHISRVLEEAGYNVESWDIVQRSYEKQRGTRDFLTFSPSPRNDKDIVTNPPYNVAAEFVTHALEHSMESVKVAMFLKLTFLEGAKRKKLFDYYPPKRIYVFGNRIDCWKNGIKPQKPSKAVCYAWFVWEKGFCGDTIIQRID